jgi:hypothetical protein
MISPLQKIFRAIKFSQAMEFAVRNGKPPDVQR